MKMRLERFISSQNFGTRSYVKKIIKSKRVQVDGIIVEDYSLKIDPLINKISIDDVIIKYKEFIYIALNKPKDYICANKDNLNKTVFDLINKYKNGNLHIVGRLDKNTTGLVLLTNDGDWSHKLKSPKSNTEKEYNVILKNKITDEMIRKIKSDIVLDNKVLKPIKFIQTGDYSCNVILTEGKYHQVKRMFHLVDNEVIELNRSRIDKLNLKELNIKIGEWKEIDINEYS
ncbi:MAG: pseudouridine synthase [Metamycoplasmataceae bacterium]